MALAEDKSAQHPTKAISPLTVRQGRTEPTAVAEEAEVAEVVTTPTVFLRNWAVAAVAPHMARPAEEAEGAVVEVLEVAVAKEAVVHLASSFTVQASQFKRRS